MTSPTLGTAIRHARERRGLSQDQLGTLLGMNPLHARRRIIEWEKDRQVPGADYTRKLLGELRNYGLARSAFVAPELYAGAARGPHTIDKLSERVDALEQERNVLADRLGKLESLTEELVHVLEQDASKAPSSSKSSPRKPTRREP